MEFYKAESRGRIMILCTSKNLIFIEDRRKTISVWADFSENPKHYWKVFKWKKYSPSQEEIALIEDATSKYLSNIKHEDVDVEFYSEYFHSYHTSTPWGEHTATSENSTKAEAEAYINSLGLNSPEENGWVQLPNGVWERESCEDRGFFHRVSL